MKVVIIGARGKMGKWFTSYFRMKNSKLFVFDLDKEGLKDLSKKYSATIIEDLDNEVKDANVVLVSIPIEDTGEMVLNLSKLVGKDSLIVEISSLKELIMPKLKEAVKKGVRILSLHPMFGPGARNLAGHKIVVVGVKDIQKEIEETREIFPEAYLAGATVMDHDKAMGIIISLTHFVNLIFSSVITRNDLDKLRELSGTSFNFQLLLAESIMQDKPSFLATLQTKNTYSTEFIEELIIEAKNLKKLINRKNDINLQSWISKIKKRLLEDEDYLNAYDKMYNIIEST